MHAAHPSADLLVPGEWPGSLLVLLQAALYDMRNEQSVSIDLH